MSAETAIDRFITQQKHLLELELHADEDQNDPSTKDDDNGGFFLRNVDVLDTSVGLYGRTVVSFGQIAADSTNSKSRTLLPAHRLTVGDDIEVLPKSGNNVHGAHKSKRRVGGVVCAVDDYSISIALSDKKRPSNNSKSNSQKDEKDNDMDEDSDMLGGIGPYTLVPRSGVEVHQKMVSALDELGRYGVNHPLAGNVILAAFEPTNISSADTKMSKIRIEQLEKECNLASTKLDYSQKEAMVFALNSTSPISLIHGPPGTGKTTTVAELIRCAVNVKNWKVLVTAPSNVAVDNVLERLMALEDETQTKGKRKSSRTTNNRKIKAVRLGHPARIQHSIQKYSLESLVQSSDGTEIVQDCRRELANHLRTLSNPKSRPPEKRNAYREMKSLRKEIRTREEKVVGEILRHANVVLATNVGAAGSVFRHLADNKGEPIAFDLVIIDEAAQALEASCWISLLRGKKAVLAGDHCQLPPTIKCSNREVQTELGKTLFERLMKAYEHNKTNWASNAMYNGKLISHESVKNRMLCALPQVEEQISAKESNEAEALQNVVLTLIDTAGCGFHEMTTDAGSRYNEGEADLVVQHVQSLLALGLHAEDIAVITPYNGQVELLRKRLLPEVPKLEIRSVDGFQGGEREAVILSLVRSSERGGKDGVGFLRDERRLNVAITRAKRHCAVICDCETVSQNKFIKGLVDWMEKNGDYRSAAELVSPNDSCHNQSTSTANTKTKSSPNTLDIKQKQTKKKETKASKNDYSTSSAAIGAIRKPETCDALKEGAQRRALMNRISQFSETGHKGDRLELTDLSELDFVVAQELASQLGLGCNGREDNALTLCMLKEARTNFTTIEPEVNNDDKNTTAFSRLDISDDESSHEDNIADTADSVQQTNFLKDLALERQRRQGMQTQQMQSSMSATQVKKNNKKKKSQKLGGEKKQAKEPKDNMDDLDDMAFLDAQIEKVQTSHGRKIDAKGKGYKSIVNGVLLTKYERPETKRTNTAAANSLQAKIKAKSEDRQLQAKKKKGK